MATGRACGVLLALLSGCTGETPWTPATLIDGSPTRPPAVALEDVDVPSVATVVRVTPGGSRVTPGGSPRVGSNAASCMAAIGSPAEGAIVERVGVGGLSVTFLGSGRRTAHACDAVGSGSGTQEAWCGHAFDRVESGRPRDPRLSLSCRSADGDPVAFAWIQPDSAATYLVVGQSRYAEVYAVAAGAPVRVTTGDADLASSRATFAISEHARDGSRIRSYELEAQVAG